MKFFNDSNDSEKYLNQDGNANNLLFIPALTGLGAPQWNPDIRGGFYGITRDTSKNDFVTAAFNSLCYQTKEILDAIREDGLEIKEISIDGGMVKNTSFTQLLANTTQTNLSIPSNTEATAIGAAKVAAVGCGLVKNIEDYCKKDMSINVQYQTYENLQNNFLIWKDYLDIMIKFTNKIK